MTAPKSLIINSPYERPVRHWKDDRGTFYFCQIEAIETLIWWLEAPAEYKQGIHVPGDGGEWERLCNKMAAGTGKTTVMAMLITWQVLNAITYPKRNKDFSRVVFIVAPGLTVKERLRVLYPGEPDNYYDAFGLCPSDASRQKLNQAEILIENWHTLMPQKQPERSVVKKGEESDEAYTRRVLGKLATYRDFVVINDEAHHAYRIPAEIKVKRTPKRPPAGSRDWTGCTRHGGFSAASTCPPRRLRRPLVQKAYTLLSADWRATLQSWREGGHVSPPVLLTVCNRTETAARIERYFSKGDAHWPEMHAPDRTLRVDSRVLEAGQRILVDTLGAGAGRIPLPRASHPVA